MLKRKYLFKKMTRVWIFSACTFILLEIKSWAHGSQRDFFHWLLFVCISSYVNRVLNSFVDDIIHDVEDSWFSFFSIVPLCKRWDCNIKQTNNNKKKHTTKLKNIEKVMWKFIFYYRKSKTNKACRVQLSFPSSGKKKLFLMGKSRIRPTMQTRNINPCRTVGESSVCMKSGSVLRGVVQQAMVTYFQVWSFLLCC